MKTKKLQMLTLALLFSLFSVCALASFKQPASAEALSPELEELESIELLSDDESPLGLYTSLSLNMGTNSEQVYATAKNEFTLFPSTVVVYVMLYSSVTYQDSYHNMLMESSNYVGDLDMGKSISTYAPINGVKRYWQARIYYKADSNDWKEKLSKVWLVDVDGTATAM